MRENKIAFITAVNDEKIYEECLKYINKLNVPDGIAIEIIPIRGATSMTSAYNAGMNYTDAKYKVYLHQDTFIFDKEFIQKLLQFFNEYKNIGICGVVGSLDIPSSGIWWDGLKVGNIIDDHTGELKLYSYSDRKQYFVQALDGLLLCTQYDIRWRDDLFKDWHFYDISQCQEFIRKGYGCGLLYDIFPPVEHHCGICNTLNYEGERKRFVKEYKNGNKLW